MFPHRPPAAPLRCHAPSRAGKALAFATLTLVAACDLSVDPATLGGTGGSGAAATGGQGGAPSCPGTGTECEDFGSSQVRLYLAGGEVNGTPVGPGAQRVTLVAGQPLAGSVVVTVKNDFASSNVVPLMLTPSWGEHLSAARQLQPTVTSTDYTVALTGLTAPAVPGAYTIIFAAAPTCSYCHIASRTSWYACVQYPECNHCAQCVDNHCEADCMLWNDGHDLADLEVEQMCNALETGYLSLPQWTGETTQCVEYGLTYLEVEVVP